MWPTQNLANSDPNREPKLSAAGGWWRSGRGLLSGRVWAARAADSGSSRASNPHPEEARATVAQSRVPTEAPPTARLRTTTGVARAAEHRARRRHRDGGNRDRWAGHDSQDSHDSQDVTNINSAARENNDLVWSVT